jgi:O-antigen/teichoic acid export membrane protein
LKVLCIVAGAALLGNALGRVESAVLGFAVASVLILVVSLVLAPREPLRGRLPVRELLSFQLFTMVFNLLVTLIARLDLQILQRFATDRAQSGDYRSAQALATIPYQAVFAITFVLFPLVSGAGAQDPARVRTYTGESTRYSLIIAALIAMCFAGAPEAAVTLLYPAEYASAGPALRVLVLGYLAFSVFYIMTAVLTAAGRPRASLALVGVVVALQAGLGFLLVPVYGAVGIAAATAIAMAAGLVLAHVTLVRGFGGGLDLGRAARILAPAAAVAAGLRFALPSGVGRFPTVVGFGTAVLVFIALLFVTGGLRREDVERFRRVFARGKPHAQRT